MAHIKEMDELFHGLTRRQVMKLAYEYAESNKISHRFENGMAGEKWFLNFCKRNNFSLRVPEKMAACRMAGFNRMQVDRFFENLRTLCETYHFKPHRIFNMDETGISTIPSKMKKVVSPTNKKKVSKLTSGDKAETITVVGCMSPTGFLVPPAMVFPRVRYHENLYKNAPEGTAKFHNETGYMNTDLFVLWLKHFQEYVKASAEDPVLLILDNHVSHRSHQAVTYCRENYIHLLTLPPHVTHEMQPLDTHFFEPLKERFSEECANFVIGKPSLVIIKLENVAELFCRAYKEMAKVSTASSAFEHSGIWPFSPNKFTDKHFKASNVTNREIENTSTAPTNHSVENLPMRSSSTSIEDTSVPEIPETKIISPSKIIPLPKSAGVSLSNVSVKRKPMKSTILTGSPYKNEVEMAEKLKEANNKIKELKLKLKDRSGLTSATEMKGKKSKTPVIKKPGKPPQRQVKAVKSKKNKNKKLPESSSESEPEWTDPGSDIEPPKQLKKLLATKLKSSKKAKENESWYCFLCNTDTKIAMRPCIKCNTYVHESCIGLVSDDEDIFTCPDC